MKTGRRNAKQRKKDLNVRFAHSSCESSCDSCEGGPCVPTVNGGFPGHPKQEKNEGPSIGKVGSLIEITTESAKGLGEAPEWEELELCVDSGASATVIGEHLLKAIAVQPGKAGVEYEVADGSKIPNLGQKSLNLSDALGEKEHPCAHRRGDAGARGG